MNPLRIITRTLPRRITKAYVWPIVMAGVLCIGCGGTKQRQSAIPGSTKEHIDTVKTAIRGTTPTLPADSAKKAAALPLSPATQLLVKACDNYITLNRGSPKTVDVHMIKASLFYNNKWYDSARSVYGVIIDRFAGSSYAFDAIRMTAQAFYEEKRYDDAGSWYKKMSEVSSDSTNKSEALARIAESVFRLAEINEAEGKFERAAQEYERVALEYPESKISDVALYNAGIAYEKLTKWSHAIMAFQKLIVKYTESRLLPKTMFQIAKCHEKLQQWDIAAENYLRIVTRFPSDELAPTAMYNAGYSFENGEKYAEAARTFEKMVQFFPQTEDAADVLFRAGELYGKIQDWEAAARVTTVFSKRFGNDENRIVQALCMTGIAHYMRNHNAEAVRELENAAVAYKKLKTPGTVNAFYAAKALFTIGEIHHGAMKDIRLGAQDNLYKRKLSDKSDLLDKCINRYAEVIKFNLSEWTTRALFQIGQAYEDFAIGIFNQERRSDQPVEKRIALELGIAQAVEKYVIGKAVVFHERNVKLGIQEKIDDKYIVQSRRKLTYLPYLAAENYLAIVEITRSANRWDKLDGFALIARRLELFQKIAPFQKRAIELYLQCLELGATYRELNEFYDHASTSITGLSLSVGSTYADVVTIARDAPIPDGFDDYEKFVYKTKLLRQIEGYEDQALDNFLKTIKIAEAYKLTDSSVAIARQRIGELLYNRGRSYDLLCINAFSYPPFPRNIDEAEKEEYKVRFEEIGLKFQEQAFDIYKHLLAFAKQSYAAGDYVTHAYIRLYQNYPDQYGVKSPQMQQRAIGTGSQWRLSTDTLFNWFTLAYNDSGWPEAGRAPIAPTGITGFPGNAPGPMWIDNGDSGKGLKMTALSQPVYFRRLFSIEEMPDKAMFYLAAQGRVSLYINAERLVADTVMLYRNKASAFDLTGKLIKGMNLIGIKIQPDDQNGHAVYPLISFTSGTEVPLPKPPGYDAPMKADAATVDKYTFPEIKNFTIK